MQGVRLCQRKTKMQGGRKREIHGSLGICADGFEERVCADWHVVIPADTATDIKKESSKHRHFMPVDDRVHALKSTA
jgi:hypothetical protein